MRHVGYQSANAQKKKRGALLIAFSTGRPRNGTPVPRKNAPRLEREHRLSMGGAHHIRSNPSHIILVLFIPIEFPRLLAKREIIANAKNVCSNVVKARTLSAAKVGISFRTTKHMERKMKHHKKLTHRHRTAINPHERGSRNVFLSQTSTGQPSLFGDTP